jgi:two-component system response regulator NreC
VRTVLAEAGGYDIVGEAEDADEALAVAAEALPDVVVLDIALRHGSGLDIVSELRALGARVLILSMEDDPRFARRAFELGAQGYLLKDAADGELDAALRQVLDGDVYICPSIAARIVLDEPDAGLDDCDREIVRLVALGHTNQEVAEQLYLSVRTVEAHRRRVMEQLHLRSRAELVQYAIGHGIARFA